MGPTLHRALGRPDERTFLAAAVEVLESPPSPAGRTLAISICALFASAAGMHANRVDFLHGASS